MDWYSILIATIQLLVITDPLGNLPIFFTLTKKQDSRERRKTFLSAVMVALVLLLLFALVGTGILSLFKITLSDFKIAGGILLLIISVLLLVKGSWLELPQEPHGLGAVPLGCPILVGPGAITTAMVLMGIYGTEIILVAIFINFIISSLILFWGESILKFMGHTGAEIVSRIMVILIAAIAIQYIRSGISEIIFNLK